jgi:hypothetical protein
VRHLSEGALRRLYDEPYALDEETRTHYRDCADCQAGFTAVAADARGALALLAGPGVTVDAASALASVRARTGPNRPRLAVIRAGWRRPLVGGLAAATLAAVLVATMALTPLASALEQVFSPTRVTPVTIQKGDLTGLDAFSSWGQVKSTSQGQLQQTETAEEAARISGMRPIGVDPARLPASLRKAPVSYAAITRSSGTVAFTGSAPARLRGATLTAVLGPAETTVYGDLGRAVQNAQSAAPQGGATGGDASAGTSRTSADRIGQALSSAGPILAVAEMRSPRITSTGASVADIKAALLAQPGLSPTVRAAISGIDDPAGNLPIPVPYGYVDTHSVTVQGVPGTALGDNTGLGSAVIWIRNGVVYAVAGTVTEDQVLAVANGLR